MSSRFILLEFKFSFSGNYWNLKCVIFSLVELIWVCMKSFDFIILMKCILITLFTKTRKVDNNLLFSF